MEMDEHCFTKNALLFLINDGNLSADSQPACQPADNKLTCEEHGDVSLQTLHRSDGKMKRGEHTSSISSLESSRLRERLSLFSSRAGPPVCSERWQWRRWTSCPQLFLFLLYTLIQFQMLRSLITVVLCPAREKFDELWAILVCWRLTERWDWTETDLLCPVVESRLFPPNASHWSGVWEEVLKLTLSCHSSLCKQIAAALCCRCMTVILCFFWFFFWIYISCWTHRTPLTNCFRSFEENKSGLLTSAFFNVDFISWAKLWNAAC